MVTADNLLEELRQRLVRLVPSLNANELDMALKEVGKGLLNECGITEAASSHAPLIVNHKEAY